MPGVPLVTGATGFAGSHLVDFLLQTEPAVAAWANPAGRAPATHESRVRWRAVDLADRCAVEDAIAELQPSAIYHCGGLAHVAGGWANPQRALQGNALGTHHVLEAVRRAGLACPILVTGSALVYRPSMLPLSEDSPIGPSDPYGFSKLAQEMIAVRATWCPVLLARSFNHAGPRQSDTYVTSGFARQIAEIETGVREPRLRVGNLRACRDITDVRDTVRAYAMLVKSGRPWTPYNVCVGRAYRISDLLDILVQLSSIHPQIEVDSARLRPSDNPVVLGNSSRIADQTGWRAEIPIERTLADLLDYWRKQIAIVR